MANRDYSLDSKIQQASFGEFMSKGFGNASLRKIAEIAGVTIGAIRTRYRTKDDLFGACIEPLVLEINKAFGNIGKVYNQGLSEDSGTKLLQDLQASMEYESSKIIDLLFGHYDEAVMLLCKSQGSVYENFMDMLIVKKVEASIEFFDQIKLIQIDKCLLKFLISMQFHNYYEIIQSGCNKAEAKKYMENFVIYHMGGWTNLLKNLVNGGLN